MMNGGGNSVVAMYRRYFRPYTAGLVLAGLCYLAFAAEGSIMAGLSRYLVDEVLEVNLITKPIFSARSKPFVPAATTTVIQEPQPIVQNSGMDVANFADGDGFVPIDGGTIARDGSLEDRIMSKPGKSVWEKVRLLAIIAFVLVTLHLFAVGMQTWANYKLSKITEQVVFKIRRHIYDKLLRLQMSFHDQNNTGRLLSRAVDDVRVIQNNFTPIMTQWAMFLGLITINTSIMFYIHVKLACITLLAMPLYVVTYHHLRKRIRELSIKQRKETASIYGLVRDRLANPRVIKGFGREKREELNFFRKAKRLFRYGREIVVLNNVLAMICTCISVLVSAVVLGYGTILLRAGELTLGYLLFFYSVSYSLFWPLAALTQITANVQRLKVSCERILSVLAEPFEIKDKPSAKTFDKLNESIVVENLSFKYPSSQEYALRDISIKIPVGSKVCLMGNSGAGKSTLGALLLRLYDPTEGRVLIDGIDLREFRLSSLRRKIAYVPQEPLLFSGTLASNILYGNPGASKEQMVRAAKLAEIDEFIESLPEKYDTIIGENGLRLSGGQKQRISLARAFLTDPEILILDDFTSALDAQTEANIHNAIKNALKDKTIIMITHRLSLASRADLIVVLDKGRIAQVGNHQELLNQEGPYWNLIKDQMDQGEVIRVSQLRDSRFIAA